MCEACHGFSCDTRFKLDPFTFLLSPSTTKMHFIFASARAQAQRMAAPPVPHTPPTASQPARSSTTSTSAHSSDLRSDPRLHINQWTEFSLPISGDDMERAGDHHTATAAAVNECLRADLAPSTLTSYNSALQNDLALAEKKLQLKLLPMHSEELFLAAFGSLLETHGRDLHWSRSSRSRRYGTDATTKHASSIVGRSVCEASGMVWQSAAVTRKSVKNQFLSTR